MVIFQINLGQLFSSSTGARKEPLRKSSTGF